MWYSLSLTELFQPQLLGLIKLQGKARQAVIHKNTPRGSFTLLCVAASGGGNRTV
jgi:hypothetical protein